ncbi:MAG TPA: glycosyltransferase family 9 protein [Acidobacteriaceae bacterium]
MSAAARHLLIVKFGAIGDVVMAIPAAYAMHCEGYAVDWMCGETVAPILRLYPWINVLAVEERPLLRGSAMERMRAMMGIWRRLAGRRYEVCATLYYDRRYAMLTWPVRARRRVRLSWEERATALLPGRHHSDEFARILLGRADGETPRQLAPVRAEGLPATVMTRVEGKPRVVLVPAGAKNMLRDDALRRWPVESYVELAAALLERGCEVVLAGGANDAWASAAFAGLGITDVIGRLSLVETLALLESTDVMVTHDTGPLHLAGITSAAIVAIFGPTDPHGRLPQRENCVALWGGEGFACRPCYDGREYAPCQHNGCVRQVTVGMVLEEIERLLEAKREGCALLPRVVVPEHTPVLVNVETVR